MDVVDLPPHSMLPTYVASDLTLDEVRLIVNMLAQLPCMHVWVGEDNSFTFMKWREQQQSLVSACCRVAPDAHPLPVPRYPGIYTVSCVRTQLVKSADTPLMTHYANLVDLVTLNRVPCTVLRSATRQFEPGWHWVTAWDASPLALRAATLVQLQKAEPFVDYQGQTHIRTLTKVCPLRTLLQWQEDAKKSMLKEENDGQFAAQAGESAGEQ